MSKKYTQTILVSSLLMLGFGLNAAHAEDAVNSSPGKKNTKGGQVRQLAAKTALLEAQMKDLKAQIATLKTSTAIVARPISALSGISSSENNFGGTSIITSPYLGAQPQYDASDLVTNLPSVNEDLYLLGQKNQIESDLIKNSKVWPDHSVVELSGGLEMQASSSNRLNGFTHGYGNDTDLVTAELDTSVFVNRWAEGYMSMAFDNSKTTDSQNRIANSHLYIDKAMMILGDLNTEPVYATLGQYYMPFGRFSTAMITDSLTKTLFRVKARGMTLGYSQALDPNNRLNLAIFGFNGNTKTSLNAGSGFHNYGANADYIISQPNMTFDFGGSYISNIAESSGMQGGSAVAGDPFNGFASNANTEIMKPISGTDARVKWGIGQVTLAAEYATANKAFDPTVMQFNNAGAKPQALHTEADYNFSVADKPSTVGIVYDKTKQALGFGIAQSRYGAVASTSLWKDTIESIEYRHDKDYSSTDVAAVTGFNPVNGTGNSANTATLKIGFYF